MQDAHRVAQDQLGLEVCVGPSVGRAVRRDEVVEVEAEWRETVVRRVADALQVLVLHLPVLGDLEQEEVEAAAGCPVDRHVGRCDRDGDRLFHPCLEQGPEGSACSGEDREVAHVSTTGGPGTASRRRWRRTGRCAARSLSPSPVGAPLVSGPRSRPGRCGPPRRSVVATAEASPPETGTASAPAADRPNAVRSVDMRSDGFAGFGRGADLLRGMPYGRVAISGDRRFGRHDRDDSWIGGSPAHVRIRARLRTRLVSRSGELIGGCQRAQSRCVVPRNRRGSDAQVCARRGGPRARRLASAASVPRLRFRCRRASVRRSRVGRDTVSLGSAPTCRDPSGRPGSDPHSHQVAGRQLGARYRSFGPLDPGGPRPVDSRHRHPAARGGRHGRGSHSTERLGELAIARGEPGRSAAAARAIEDRRLAPVVRHGECVDLGR